MNLAPVATNPAAVLTAAKTIAVVGMSSDPAKPANFAPMELHRRGWTVIPVNPNADEIAGLKSYATLGEVPVPIDVVNVFRPAAEAPGIAVEAARVGAKALWLQKGIVSDEARQVAEAAGMDVVQDLCAGATSAHLDLYPAS